MLKIVTGTLIFVTYDYEKRSKQSNYKKWMQLNQEEND